MAQSSVSVQNLPVEMIKPYWRNPRAISSEAVDKVAASIKDYGMNVPLVLDPQNVIINGHTRYKACVQLGLKEVPCIVTELSPEKAKEYRIADNKVSENTTWDHDALMAELRETETSVMQQYFNIDLSEVLQEAAGAIEESVAIPTNEEVEQATANAADRFEQTAVQRTQNHTLDIICPECGAEFAINEKHAPIPKQENENGDDNNDSI